MVAKATAHMEFNLDSVKRKTTEQILMQLITEVTNVETAPLDGNISPESLIHAVAESTAYFCVTAEDAIMKNTVVDTSMLLAAARDVRNAGDVLVEIGRDFVRDSSSNSKRTRAVTAGRELLNAISRLLILADQIDINLIINQILEAEKLLDLVRNSSTVAEVEERYRRLDAHMSEVLETVRRRVGDLRNPDERNNIDAAHGQLLVSLPLVYSSTKAFVRHPECIEAKQNCDFAYKQARGALEDLKIPLSGDAQYAEMFSNLGNYKNLAYMLDDFQNRVYMEQHAYRPKHRRELEGTLEDIITKAGSKLCDSGFTREERRHAIVDECNNLRQALQNLLKQYEDNYGRPQSEDVDRAMVQVGHTTKNLRRHLRRAVVDHISDALVDRTTNLYEMIDGARCGNFDKTKVNAAAFLEHAQSLTKCAEAACEMTNDTVGLQVIRHIGAQLVPLSHQVVAAAYLLCSHPDSEVINANMNAFRDVWLDKVELLTRTIDAVISLDDFLAVSELHIAEDARKGEHALTHNDYIRLDNVAGLIRGRARRVCEAVDAEMEALPATSFSEVVKTATVRLKKDKLPQFENTLVDMCSADPDEERDTNADHENFVDACSLVHNGVKDIRNALLLNRNPDEVDSDNEYEDDAHLGSDHGRDGKAAAADEQNNEQNIMRRLPEEHKQKIKEQIDVFKITQTTFEREVAKWDETGNDIIVLAKHMCTIMMNMTDFTRGRGPLKSNMDVIRAAQEISVAGSKLLMLAEQIGNESANSQSKKDLFANTSKIPTYCQQLNICSKVKADVQQIGQGADSLVLDSAMSLIQTARNLLSAVVQTVKDAYIASTKFRRPNAAGPRVEWNMAPPQMHPLVRPQTVNNASVIRRASERRPMRPEQALAQFRQ